MKSRPWKLYRWIPCFLILVVAMAGSRAFAAGSDPAAQALFTAFTTEYKALDVPEMDLSYRDNFAHVQSLEGIARQQAFFARMHERLDGIDRRALSDEVRYEVDALRYEIVFNLDRLALERKFRSAALSAPVPASGLFHVPYGKEWYKLYIRRWGSRPITPHELVELGEAEVARVRSEMRSIQKRLGYEGRDADFYRHLNGPLFQITSEADLKATFIALRDRVQTHLGADFEPVTIPTVDIRPWANPTRDTPPGYWDNSEGAFHYTFYAGHFPRRALEWLFLHEAVPGHHYQNRVDAVLAPRPEIRAMFWYPGFSEGWAAYAEDLGKDIGCYGDLYQLLGKWEWDLVRSARVVLDVRIHSQGWTREQALSWWHEHVPNQDGIAEREVDRIIRWPAQVVSYKVGEHAFLTLRALAEKRPGPAFDLRRFHTLVLQRGSIPLPVLEEIVHDDLARRTGPRMEHR